MNTKLNVKQWAIASFAAFVIMTLVAFILIRLGIEPWGTAATPTTGQHDPGSQRILIYLSRIALAGLFTFIFTKGVENKPGLGEGIRYGMWMGLLLNVPPFFMNLATTDWPASSHIIRMVVGIIEMTICGIAVAQLYKPNKA